ncbi:MAG TPA: hypothetical protein VFL83_12815 [Anaeromyxobacter sp.]|nr:hypothetical protein [Anaeromyxobacter sp.]
MHAILPVLAALAASDPAGRAAAAPSGGALEQRREAIANELVAVGAELRRAIERGDAAAIVARIPDAGLRCGDRTVPKARVAHDLASPDTWLHGAFFGGPGYEPPPGTAPSLVALLRGPGEVAIVVSFVRDRRAGELGRPCLDFRVEGVGTPGVPICFEQRGGRWWIVESLYPC